MSRLRPVRPSSRQRTSIEAIREGLRECSRCSALREVELKSSEPAKRIRRGGAFFSVEYHR
jgi:hypothetical protein